jgi:hypothetical protein
MERMIDPRAAEYDKSDRIILLPKSTGFALPLFPRSHTRGLPGRKRALASIPSYDVFRLDCSRPGTAKITNTKSRRCGPEGQCALHHA